MHRWRLGRRVLAVDRVECLIWIVSIVSEVKWREACGLAAVCVRETNRQMAFGYVQEKSSMDISFQKEDQSRVVKFSLSCSVQGHIIVPADVLPTNHSAYSPFQKPAFTFQIQGECICKYSCYPPKGLPPWFVFYIIIMRYAALRCAALQQPASLASFKNCSFARFLKTISTFYFNVGRYHNSNSGVNASLGNSTLIVALEVQTAEPRESHHKSLFCHVLR